MAMTKQRVLYRQGSGFWRMTAKWAVFFGVVSVLDGALIRTWGHAVVWPMIGVVLWAPIGVGAVWYPRKDRQLVVTPRELRIRRRRLPMEDVNLLHVARLWLEGRSTADDLPASRWNRSTRVVWVPLKDGEAYGVELGDPAAFAKVFGEFAVAACGGPDVVRARAAAETYPEPRPRLHRSTADGSRRGALDLFD
ncbi:hypothetical protein [Streptomyces sp. NPDC048606]|uniref:hypothetical protein n=1 Tax=Streptomyces sp. NPDC048606 TaxID=3154726 RepID=UPI00341C7E77